MWRQFSDGISNLSSWAQEKVTGDASTAEYYNPCPMNEGERATGEDYARPGYNSVHIAEAKLDRVVDDLSDLSKKYTGLDIGNILSGDSTGIPQQNRARNPIARELAQDLSQAKPAPSQDINDFTQSSNSIKPDPFNSNSNNNTFPSSSLPPPTKKPGELTFVFHSATTDTEERVCHDSAPEGRRQVDELPYIITIDGSKVSERLKFPPAIAASDFLSKSASYLNYGDLLECVADQCKSHWVMWLGFDGQQVAKVIHFSKRGFTKKIAIESLVSACRDRPIRRINDHFTYTACAQDRIKAAVVSVMKQNTQQFAQNFDSSESFASWLRYQQDDFLNKKCHDQDFRVQFIYGKGKDGSVVVQYPTLSHAINQIRLKQKEGKESLEEAQRAAQLLLF